MFKSILSVSFILLLGRISGFFREWLIADKIGADSFSDFAMVLITIPDLMVSLLIGGGFAAAIIPKFKQLKEGDAFRLFSQLFIIIGAAFLLLSLALSVFSTSIIYILAPGLPESFVKENQALFWIVTIGIPLAACSGILKAKMDAYSLFIYGAFGTLIFNMSIIALILFPIHFTFLESIAIGVVAGALLRLIFQLIGFRKTFFSIDKKSDYNGLDKNLFFTIFNTITFSAVLVLLPIIARSISSINNEGALSLFTYAYRMNELAITLIVGAMITIFLPTLSTLYAKNRSEDLMIFTVSSIRTTLIICFSISIPIIFYADEIIELIFFSTMLDKNDLSSMSLLLIISYIFLPFRALLVLLFPILSAIKANKNFLLMSFFILATIIVIAIIFTNIYGLAGTMIAYGVTNIVGSIALYYILIRNLGIRVFKDAMSQPLSCFLIPIFLSVIINTIGTRYFSGEIYMIFFCIFSILLFLYIALKNDMYFKLSNSKFKEIQS